MSDNEKDEELGTNLGIDADEPVEAGGKAEPDETASETGGEPGASEGADVFTGAAQPQPPYGQPYPPFAGQYQYGRPGTPPPFYYGKPGQPYGMPPQFNQPAQYGQQPPPPPTKGRKKGLNVFLSILAVLVVVSLLASAFALGRNMVPKGGADTNATTSGGPSLNINETPTESGQPSANGALSTVQVAEKVKPSVIGILVYSEQTNLSTGSKNTAGEGSGIVMGTDASGEYTYIITCAHVISDKGVGISIQLDDGVQHKAELVGYDLRTDVGVIKVKLTGLRAAEFGNSGALKVGEPVYAVGNPGGTEFYGSFTSGVVSAIDRPVNSEIGYTMELIQHDAAINPGNSGGALVNAYGQVIGINSLKIIDSKFEGMGFAIPIGAAKIIVDSIIQYGYVPNRPKLGITYYAANTDQTYNMIINIKGLPAGSLYINEISPDSGLANTDAKKGDLITEVNGKKLDTANVLLEIIDKGKVGDTLDLTLCRIGRDYSVTEFNVKVQLVEDKGTTVPAGTTEETTTNPFEYFFNPFG